MEALGPKIRRQRRRLGLTLDDLAGRTGISKPYLSLIETGRVANPPSDEKLRKLEQTLGFTAGELITQAHLQRTPRDVRAVLQRLIETKGSSFRVQVQGPGKNGTPATISTSAGATATLNPIDLDDAYLSGVLQDLVDRSAGNIEEVTPAAAPVGNPHGNGTGDGQAQQPGVPVINRVSAGYPRDFTDLSYPPRVADEYVSCPDLNDRDAFAARVHGDSMTPKYREGDIVIFSPAQQPRDGDDCFVRFADGHTTFKRVFFETGPDGNARVLRLQPRNEKYRPQVVPAEQVSGLYKAMYRYQRVDED
jgi:SOS-response transcriptional repressor LexA